MVERWQVIMWSSGQARLYLLLLIMLPLGASANKVSVHSASLRPDAAGHKQHETLETFCGQTLGGGPPQSNMIVDCSCCATSHLSGDYSAQVVLQFGGHLTTAEALENGREVGKVPAWSLSDFVPQVTCGKSTDDLMCHCADGHGKRMMMESACQLGPPCRKTAAPIEWPSKLQEGHHSAERDRALGRGHNGKHDKESELDQGQDRHRDPHACTEPSRHGRNDVVTNRVSLGASKCEDASPEQCHLFYAKVGHASWHHCEAKLVPKTCHAMVRPEAQLRAEAQELKAWGARHAFTPEAWPVTINADGVVEFDKHPEMEVFQMQVDNLPPKVFQPWTP